MSCPLGKKPTDDRDYPEAMAKVIFGIGLSRSVVERKWENILKVFSGFDPDKVARFTASDTNRIVNNREAILTTRKSRLSYRTLERFF